MSEEITKAHRKALRSEAQHLEPTVFYGKNGMSEAFLVALEQELAQRQLVKVRLTTEKARRKEIAKELAEKSGAALVDLVGHVVVLFRAKNGAEEPAA